MRKHTRRVWTPPVAKATQEHACSSSTGARSCDDVNKVMISRTADEDLEMTSLYHQTCGIRSGSGTRLTQTDKADDL
jgi:hypothetical protein